MINIICVGKIKEKFYVDACGEYIKRLSKYTKLNIIELPDYKDEVLAKSKESVNILKYVNEKDYIITLEIDGKEFDSISLSKLIDDKLIHSKNITFIIGGSYGLDDSVKKISNLALSFSKLTFPHQLFRVILLEQIYRAFKIINNETYHK
jgi:23S rRNA (pseudouridine1915-N3)-methyltransferase